MNQLQPEHHSMSSSGRPTLLRRFLGERGLQAWVFYLPLVFMVVFFAVPMALTLVWSVFERTQFLDGARVHPVRVRELLHLGAG